MAAQTDIEPQIILYDLACTKGVCFSPAVWRIRMMLNYKRVPYKTIFLEFQDIEPTLKQLGLVPVTDSRYTVPAIYHVASNKYMMDSTPISEFLESTYPEPPLQLTSKLGQEVQLRSRTVFGPAYRNSITPREVQILSPLAQDFFRRRQEPALGHPLEDLLDPEREEQKWLAARDGMQDINELLQTHKAEGPFLLGARPSYTDFSIVGSLQTTRVIHEPVFERFMDCPGYRQIYEACLPYLEKNN